MMGKQDNQIQMVILDIDSMIPHDYLMRQIEKKMWIICCAKDNQETLEKRTAEPEYALETGD